MILPENPHKCYCDEAYPTVWQKAEDMAFHSYSLGCKDTHKAIIKELRQVLVDTTVGSDSPASIYKEKIFEIQNSIGRLMLQLEQEISK